MSSHLNRSTMAKTTKYVRVKFRQAPPKSGYFTNRIHEVPEELADEYVELGYAQMLTPTLPNDIPGREELIKNDILTLKQVLQQAETLEDLEGIGKTTAGKIRAYLKKESTKD